VVVSRRQLVLPVGHDPPNRIKATSAWSGYPLSAARQLGGRSPRFAWNLRALGASMKSLPVTVS